jgi:hypothetical protein
VTINPDAQALAAKGHPITLLDGSTVRLRYSMASLVQLEDRFGSLAGIMSVVQEAADVMDAQEKVRERTATEEQKALVVAQVGKPSLFGIIARVVLPGLMDAQAAHPRTGQPFYLGDDEQAALRLLDPGLMREYLEAFAEAFRESMHLSGGAPGEAVPAAPAPPAPMLVPSHGPTGTTQPAPSAFAVTSSGA